MKIAIIGAGAAGCFAAIEIKRRKPEAVISPIRSAVCAVWRWFIHVERV